MIHSECCSLLTADLVFSVKVVASVVGIYLLFHAGFNMIMVTAATLYRYVKYYNTNGLFGCVPHINRRVDTVSTP